MNLLIDSHVLLWALSAPEKLAARARDAITEPANSVFYSAASVWELELKAAKGKLALPPDWLAAAGTTGFTEWKIDAQQAIASARLPWIHSDPFDRLFVALAQLNDLTLVTRDRILRSYRVRLIEA